MDHKSTLAEKLAKLVNPAPSFDDSDQERNSETEAQIVDYSEELKVSDDHQSKLRVQTANLLSGDSRYVGRTVSRKKVQNLELEEDCEEEIEEEEQFRQKNKCVTFKEKFEDFESIDSNSSEDSDDEVEDEDDGNENYDEEEHDDLDDDSNEESDDMSDGNENSLQDETGFKSFSKIDIKQELEQAKGTQSLLLLWDYLLETRITLQKGLQIINQIPQFDVWNAFMSDGDKEFKKIYTEGEKSVEILLNKLTTLQTLLLKKNPKTRNNYGGVKKGNDEITSESDISETEEPMETTTIEKNLKRKFHFEEYPDLIAKRHKEFEIYQNDTIKKWNDRTRLSSGKLKNNSFAAFEQSALKQIEQILNDKFRLLRRTKLRRTNYRILGTVNNVNKSIDETEDLLKKNHEEYNEEIFDDDDFYHLLLREFIEKKTVDVKDPIALGRQWLEIQKIRSKMKRKVDTKASKGRRLRFDSHPKLVNFMAPIEQAGITETSRNELFSSLFGKKSIKF